MEKELQGTHYYQHGSDCLTFSTNVNFVGLRCSSYQFEHYLLSNHIILPIHTLPVTQIICNNIGNVVA